MSSKHTHSATSRLRRQYIQHPEYKCLAPDGRPCKADSHGLLKRYPVTASEFHLIGKETERNEGLRCKKRLWREAGRKQLESFRLAPWEPATARSAGVAGSIDPDDRGADASDRAGSGEAPKQSG